MRFRVRKACKLGIRILLEGAIWLAVITFILISLLDFWIDEISEDNQERGE